MEFDKPVDVVMKVVRMGKDITPGHEALWAFVRGCVIGMENVLNSEEQDIVMRFIGLYVKEMEEAKDIDGSEAKNLDALKRLIRIVHTAKVAS